MQLSAIITQLSGAHITCVGDVMLDQYRYGTIERLSPEAPVPVLRQTALQAVPGGAGNVVRNLAELGARSTLCSVVGADDEGRHLRCILERLPRTAVSLHLDPSRVTTVKTRFVGQANHQLLRLDRETTDSVSSAAAATVLSGAERSMRDSDILLLSDYGKGVLTRALLEDLIRWAQSRGLRIVADPKGKDYSRYRGATILTPNRQELAAATGMPVDDDAQAVAACTTLMDTIGVEAIAATLSEQGIILVQRGGAVHRFPARAREVFDVSGAGDTVVATLAAALAVGASIPEAVELANLAAGIVVGKSGTSSLTALELLDAYHNPPRQARASKVGTWAETAICVDAWRRAGQRVAFTNGCFDLLHPGHTSLLASSRAHADRLVVGLNSDQSVRQLKGPSRPVQTAEARASVLASLADVDLVTVFDQETPLELIRLLRPDVLIKGADYAHSTVVGADFVASYGGRVALIDLVPDQSTTAIVSRLGSVSNIDLQADSVPPIVPDALSWNQPAIEPA
jgi:D-beta-D-heptose 7-phosphate kinase/D-beta-D-heptose 1-phosphate adenosyltransferase